MKSWFPFTDYDFYAYLTAGMFLISAVDYTFGGAVLIHRTEWTVVQIVFWTAVAYLLGQMVAGPASACLEHGLARGILHPPVSVALGLSRPRLREEIARRLFANREYAPLSDQVRIRVLEGAAAALKVHVEDVRDAEAVFSVAFGVARSSSDTASRLDQFRNQYGFNRNVCFVSIVSFFLIAFRWDRLPSDIDRHYLLVACAIFSIGMFGRFLKFYATYSREVLGAYSSSLFSDSKDKQE